MDPVGTAVLFHALTDGTGRTYARRMALRAVFISTIIVLLFGFFGEQLFSNLAFTVAR